MAWGAKGYKREAKKPKKSAKKKSPIMNKFKTGY